MEVLRTFDQECLNAADNARRTLITILQDNADTEYGKKYHFSDISSVSEYKKQVPFSTFEDYAFLTGGIKFSILPAKRPTRI